MFHRSNKYRIEFALMLAALVVLAAARVVHAQVFVSTSAMATPRNQHTATLLSNGKVLVIGGDTHISNGDDGASTSAEIYDPATGTFSTTGSMTAARFYHTATLLPNGNVLVIGGCCPGGYQATSTAEVYDPTTGTFSATGGMTTRRLQHTATLLANGQVLVAGGVDGVGYLASAEIYDPATGQFSPTGNMATARTFFTATLLGDGRVMVAGGWPDASPATLASAEIYDPATGQFSATGSMAAARFAHTATVLADGRVLVAGGSFDGFGYPGAAEGFAELYDPANGEFTATGNLTTARYYHRATLLPNGRVLVTGGLDGEHLASAELYDPASGTFLVTGSLHTARREQTATLLGTGLVLVTGGLGGDIPSTVPLTSAELFGPFAAAPTPVGTNVVVSPPDGASNTTPVTLTFDNVTEAGETTLITSAAGPVIPSAFALGNPAVFYNLTTTAQFSGLISMCVDFSGVSFPDGSVLRLLHFDGGVWQDVTTSGPTGTVICGGVTSLSPFAVVRVQRMVCSLFDQTKACKTGSTAPIKLQLCGPSGVNLSSASIPLIATGLYLVSNSAPGPLAASGNSNPDYQFRFAGGSYIFNLSLKGFAHGTYALTVRAGDDPTTFTVQFQVK